ncbi:hypothetical protein [Variovorax sp. IB41]|uniref:hypothetical protein n=1 Tax=Variovorax sp. IB41 TaxID=2779370 RepID=UPI0018E7666C|nr:hypothetical protein [Variovorax sp. IB41]MBJ2155253.1 hypothetical protein [Variovorax sp. IB41]
MTTEHHQYKGVDFKIDLMEAGGRWDWMAHVDGQTHRLKESRARTEDAARSEATDSARRAISRRLGSRTYKRNSDGLEFTYEVEYSIYGDRRADWNARVFCEGDPAGTPGGQAAKINNLDDAAVYHLVCTLTEQSIEHRVGVAR